MRSNGPCLLLVGGVFAASSCPGQPSIRAMRPVVTTFDALPTPLGPRPVSSIGGTNGVWGEIGQDGTIVFAAVAGRTLGYWRDREGQIDLIVRPGDPAPSGAVFRDLRFVPGVAEDGTAIFTAQMNGAAPERETLWGFAGALELIVQGGDPAPVSGAPQIFEGFSSARVSTSGTLSWVLGVLQPSGDRALFSFDGSAIREVARDGDDAAGLPGVTITGLTLPTYAALAGATIYRANTSLGGGWGTWRETTAGDELIMYPGITEAPPIGSATGVFRFGQVQFDPTGQFGIVVDHVEIPGKQPIMGIWSWSASGFDTVVLEGEPIDPADPQGPKLVFNNSPNTASAAVTSAGQMRVAAEVEDAHGTRWALMHGDRDGLGVVIAVGDPNPFEASSETVVSILRVASNDAGQVVVVLGLGGPGVSSRNDSALGVWSPNGWTLLARKGEPIDLGGGVAGVVSDMTGGTRMPELRINDRGQILFGAEIDESFQALVLAEVGACYADCSPATGAGVLDVFDFICFQDAFSENDPYACDCDTSTGPSTCDIFDFICFQDAFVAGCGL